MLCGIWKALPPGRTRELLSACRRVFEPFSGLHQAVTAARDATDPDKVVNMARNGAPFLAWFPVSPLAISHSRLDGLVQTMCCRWSWSYDADVWQLSPMQGSCMMRTTRTCTPW